MLARLVPQPFFHHRLAMALRNRGYVVKTVERCDYHGVWNLSLRPGTVAEWKDCKTIRRLIADALRDAGCHQCKAVDVAAVVTGQVLQAYLIWEIGRPGIVTFWSTNRNPPRPAAMARS